jgi:hypothetical protein
MGTSIHGDDEGSVTDDLAVTKGAQSEDTLWPADIIIVLRTCCLIAAVCRASASLPELLDLTAQPLTQRNETQRNTTRLNINVCLTLIPN